MLRIRHRAALTIARHVAPTRTSRRHHAAKRLTLPAVHRVRRVRARSVRPLRPTVTPTADGVGMLRSPIGFQPSQVRARRFVRAPSRRKRDPVIARSCRPLAGQARAQPRARLARRPPRRPRGVRAATTSGARRKRRVPTSRVLDNALVRSIQEKRVPRSTATRPPRAQRPPRARQQVQRHRQPALVAVSTIKALRFRAWC